MKDVVYVRQKRRNSNQWAHMQRAGSGLTSKDWHMCIHLCFRLCKVFMVYMNLFIFIYLFFIIAHFIQLTGKATVILGGDRLFPNSFWLLFLFPPFWTSLSIITSASISHVFFTVFPEHSIFCFKYNRVKQRKPRFLPEVVVCPRDFFMDGNLLVRT